MSTRRTPLDILKRPSKSLLLAAAVALSLTAAPAVKAATYLSDGAVNVLGFDATDYTLAATESLDIDASLPVYDGSGPSNIYWVEGAVVANFADNLIQKIGTGTAALSNDAIAGSDLGGSISVVSGTLALFSGNTNVAATSLVNVANGASFVVVGSFADIGQISLNGSGDVGSGISLGALSTFDVFGDAAVNKVYLNTDATIGIADGTTLTIGANGGGLDLNDAALTIVGDGDLLVGTPASANGTTLAANITKKGLGSANLGDLFIGAASAETFDVQAGSLTVGALDLNDSALTIDGDGTFTAGVTTNSLGLTKNGTGAATLGDLSVLPGELAMTVTVNGGTLDVGALDLVDTTSLTLAGTNAFTATSASNVTDITKSGAGTATLGDITFGAAVTASTFTINAGSLVVGKIAATGEVALTLDTAATASFTADSTGALGSIVKKGAGTATFKSILGSLTSVDLQAGVLELDGATGADTSAVALAVAVADGATLKLDPINISGTVNIQGVGAPANDGALVSVSGANTINALNLLNTASVAVQAGSLGVTTLDQAGFALTVAVADGASFSATTTAHGSSVTKNGDGSADLGATTLAPAAGTATLTVNGGTLAATSLDLNGTNLDIDVVNAPLALQFGLSAGSVTNAGAAVTVTKKGAGLAKLSGFTLGAADSVIVNAGALAFGDATDSAATVTVNNGGTVGFDTATTGAKLTGAVTINGTGALGTGAALGNIAGDNSITTLTLGSASTIGSLAGTLAITTLDAATFKLTADLEGDVTVTTSTAVGDVDKSGAAKLDLGAVTLATSPGATFTVNEGTLVATSLDLNGTNLDIDVVTAPTGPQFDFKAETVTNGGAAVTVTKVGDGLAKLSGVTLGAADTVLVNAGGLAFGDATDSAATVTVKDGAILGFETTTVGAKLTGAVTINGAGFPTGPGASLYNLSGDNSITTLTLGSASAIKSDAGTLAITTLEAATFKLTADLAGDVTVTTSNAVGDVTKTGTANLDLGTATLGANALFTIEGGELKATDLTLAGKTLGIDGANNLTVSGTTTADADITKDGAGTGDLGKLVLAADLNLTVNAGKITATSTSGDFNLTKKGVELAKLGAFSIGASKTLDIQAGTAEVNDTTNSGVAVTIASGATLSLDSTATGTAVMSGALSIAGTGATGLGGAIVSVSGTNTVGNVTQTAASTIKVTTGSLTAGDLNGAFTLTLNVADAASTFTAGKTGTVNAVTKEGPGTAKLGTVQEALDLVTVNGGVLEFLGTDSSLADRHLNLTKEGTGELQFKAGNHFYGATAADGLILNGGTTTVKTGASLDAFVTVGTAAVFNVELGATHIGEIVSSGSTVSDIVGTSTGNVTLNVGGLLTVTTTGTLNGNLTGNDDTRADVNGQMNGNATLNDNADFYVNAGGNLLGNITANNDAFVSITGITTGDTITGTGASHIVVDTLGLAQGRTQAVEITLSDAAFFGVNFGGSVLGNITGRNVSQTFVLGTLTGGIDLTGDADLWIVNAAGNVGTVNGEVTLTGDNQADGDPTSALIDGTLNGNLTLTNDATLSVGVTGRINGNVAGRNTSTSTIAGALTGDLALTSTATLQLAAGATIVGNATVTQSTQLNIAGAFSGDVSAANSARVSLQGSGSLTGDVSLVNGSTLVTDTATSLIGEVQAKNTASVDFAGTSVGNVDLSDNAVLTLRASGVMTGDLTMADDALALVAGAVTGNASLIQRASLHVQLGGSLTGDLSLINSTNATVDGTVTGATSLSNTASIAVFGTINGSIAARSSATVSVLGAANADVSLAGLATYNLAGIMVGNLTAADTTTATLTAGSLTGDSLLSGAAQLRVFSPVAIVGNVTASGTSGFLLASGATTVGNLTLSGAANATIAGALTGATSASGTSQVSVSGSLTGDLSLANSATASVTGIATTGSGTLSGDSALTVADGATFGGNTLVASGTTDILVQGSGAFQGVSGGSNAVTLSDSATLTVSAAAGIFKSSLTASGSTVTSIAGVATGDTTLSGGAQYTLGGTGSLSGNLTASASAVSTINGTAVGNATLSGGASLSVSGTGSITGNLTSSGTSSSVITGVLTGDLSLADTATSTVRGTATTGSGSLSGDSTLTVASGAVFGGNTLVASGTSDILVQGSGALQGVSGGSNAVTLSDSATLTVSGVSGVFKSSLTASGSTVTNIAGVATGAATLSGDATLGVTGSLTGALTASGTSDTTIAGTATGNATLSGDATLGVTGSLTGALTASGTSDTTIAGTATGNATLSGASTLAVSGTLTGDLSLANTATASVTGTATTGSAALSDDSALTIASGATFAGNTLVASGTTDIVVNGTGKLQGVSGGSNAVTLSDSATLTVSAATGTFKSSLTASGSTVTNIAGVATGAATLSGDATLGVTGSLTGNLTTSGTADATISGVLTGSATASGSSTYTLSGTQVGALTVSDSTVASLTGSLTGNVAASGAATSTVAAGSTVTGDFTASGTTTTTVNGTVTGNFDLSGGLLKGRGTIGGNLVQTGGSVAPGNSPGVTTVGGNYSNNAGTLVVEIDGIAGAGVANGHDKLAVGGTVTLGGTSNLQITRSNSFESARTQVFQVLTSSDANATRDRFATLTLSNANRVLFDHSSGKAYGTGLVAADNQTFADYAGTDANRRSIGKALWDASVVNNAFILTSGGTGVQVATDLGQAAVNVLTAADPGLVLDTVSPEVYAGITELGVRNARNFAQKAYAKRGITAAGKGWDFSVGYASDQATSTTGSSGYTNYKLSNDQINLTASRVIEEGLRFAIALGHDDGKVRATGFTADTSGQALGLALSLTPESKAWIANLGVALTRMDWTATHSGSTSSADHRPGYGVSLMIEKAPKATQGPSVVPFAGLTYASQKLNAVNEDSALSGVQVAFDAYERKSLVSELGLKLNYALKSGTEFSAIASWNHEFTDRGATEISGTFADAGAVSTPFKVTSAGLGQDAFRLGLGVRFNLTDTSALSFGYDAMFSSDSKSNQGLRADLSVRF